MPNKRKIIKRKADKIKIVLIIEVNSRVCIAQRHGKKISVDNYCFVV